MAESKVTSFHSLCGFLLCSIKLVWWRFKMLKSGQISISKALSLISNAAQSRRLRPLWGAFFLLTRLVNMNNGVRSVYHGISVSCRPLSMVMRYNINSVRVIRNNIAHSGLSDVLFLCIMDYLSGISWPFLVPTYPRVLPIFCQALIGQSAAILASHWSDYPRQAWRYPHWHHHQYLDPQL